MAARRELESAGFTLTIIIPPGTAPDDNGDVVVQFGTDPGEAVPLPGREFRVLRILAEARINDEQVAAEVAEDLRVFLASAILGLRSAAVIQSSYAMQAGLVTRVSLHAIRTYVLNLRRKIGSVMERLAEGSGSDGEIPWAIDSVRDKGYRIGNLSVVIIDRRKAEPDDTSIG